MADKTGILNVEIAGERYPVRFKDNGDGTYAMLVAVVGSVPSGTSPLATEQTLQDTKDAVDKVRAAILAEIEVSELVWVNAKVNPPIYYVRRVEIDGSGAETILWYTPGGVLAVPQPDPSDLRPVGEVRDIDTDSIKFQAVNDGDGYSVGDILILSIGTDTSTTPPSVAWNFWLNVSVLPATILTSAPLSGDVVQMVQKVFVDNLPTDYAKENKQPGFGTAGVASVDVSSVQGVDGGVPIPISGTVTATVAGVATEAKQDDGITQLTNLNTAVGVQGDTAATTDTGSFSVISFIKRGLQNWTSLLGRLPGSLGQNTSANSLPVVLPSDQTVSVNTGLSQPLTDTQLRDSAVAVSVGNFPSTQNVAGTVNVGNFPATQPVSGSVSVNNFPATQAVTGTVSVSNFPSDYAKDVTLTNGSQKTQLTDIGYVSAVFTPVSGVFSAGGQNGTAFVPIAGRGFNITFGFSGAGSVGLEKSFDGGTTWAAASIFGGKVLYTTTAGANLTESWAEEQTGVSYRLTCVSASGNITWRVSQ